MIRRLTVGVCVISLLGAATASAGESSTRVWPTDTILYRDLASSGGYSAAIARAVAAWNRVGVGVRFVPAGERLANVQIVYSQGRCLSGNAGRAPLGFQQFGARVVVRSCPPVVRSLLIAHELGRVLGLANDERGCSLMNSKGASDGRTYVEPAHCPRDVLPRWLPQLVDPVTAARARALYTAPRAALDVAFTAGAMPRLDWREPLVPATRTLVLRTAGRCPTPADVVGRTGAVVVYDRPAYAGRHWMIDRDLSQPATYCYRLFNLSRLGRPTPSASFTFALTAPPVAVAAVTTQSVHGQPTSFADKSSGTIVHWNWDFGDPSSGAADMLDTSDPQVGRAPTHTYAQPGSYTVTLTVTDDLARTATTMITVNVA